MQFLRDDVDAMMDIINDGDYFIKFSSASCNFHYSLKQEEPQARLGDEEQFR